jgi:uncharacterized protein (DUF302 family)
MINKITIQHYEHVSARSFDEVVALFEGAVGSVEEGGLQDEVSAASDAVDFEIRVRAHEGSSGFMRFLTTDHGAWLARIGVNAKARMYTIGNPLIARTMLEHDVAAGLNVPVRLMIYEDAQSGTTRFVYDLPSSLMSGLQNEKVSEAAKKLDAKLVALADYVTGAEF